jgi:hypothetical protein
MKFIQKSRLALHEEALSGQWRGQQSLPAWLTFDPATRQLTARPRNEAHRSHYEFNSMLRRFYFGELPKSLMKQAGNNGYRGIAV